MARETQKAKDIAVKQKEDDEKREEVASDLRAAQAPETHDTYIEHLQTGGVRRTLLSH